MNSLVKFVRTPKEVAYYMALTARNIHGLRYRYKDTPVIYGIRNQVTNRIYIGSTLHPHLRFGQHLVTGNYSNSALQADIADITLMKFTVHIFETVEFPIGMSTSAKKLKMITIEQRYMSLFPKEQLYNSIGALSVY